MERLTEEQRQILGSFISKLKSHHLSLYQHSAILTIVAFPSVSVTQWRDHPLTVQEVIGLNPAIDSRFFFVPHLRHADLYQS